MGDDRMTVGMRSLWEKGLFMDLTIQTEGRNFLIHKVVVMAMSDFFHGMFTGSTTERQKDSVKIKGVSAVAMETLISFMYTNDMTLTQENAAEVLAGAVYLQIPGAVEACIEFIISHPKAENWHNSLSLFRSFNLMQAADTATSYVKKNIREMVKTVSYGQLRYAELCFFVENWQSAEYELFQFVIKWVVADFVKRERHLVILTKVRYGLMTPGELNTISEMQYYHQTPNAWSHLVDKAIEYHDLPIYQKVLFESEQTKVRSEPNLVLFSGANHDGDAYLWDLDKETSSGYFFEPLKERCLVEHKYLNIPEEFTRCYGKVVVNNYLILCTGSPYKRCQLWYIFNPRTLQWDKMAALPGDIKKYILAHDDTCLYAVGGMIHRYYFDTNIWSDVATLPIKASGYGVCVYDDGLYVLGGMLPRHPKDMYHQNREYSDNLVRLDLSSLIWETKAPMLKPQLGCKAHLMKLFGEDVVGILHKRTEVEYYSFSADQWSKCTFSLSAPLPMPPDQDSFYKQKVPEELFKENTCFILDVDTGKMSNGEKLKACVAVTYPEDGTVAVVDFLCEYEGEIRKLPHRGKDDLTFMSDYRDELRVQSTHLNVLAIAAHIKPLNN